MAHPLPHNLALFSLRPFPVDDERAGAVVADPANAHLASVTDGIAGLDVGFHIRGKSSTTLAVLGRGPDADIYVAGSIIGKMQCSFEVNPDNGVVMLHDRSHQHSTQVFGKKVQPFQHGRTRKVAVGKDFNTIVGMGGLGCAYVQFELIWHHDLVSSPENIRRFADMAGGRVVNPRLAWTTNEVSTELPSRHETRLHTPGLYQPKTRYAKLRPMGAGAFGTVHQAIDVDTGGLMAVKILEKPRELWSRVEWEKNMKLHVKREIEILSIISHPHIVNYIGAQGWHENTIEIFMGLKEGSLESLISKNVEASKIAETVLYHMLQALDFIACKDIIHRDVKPENILYTTDHNGQYSFQLGDFGLCNRASIAATCSGSLLYMAPEIVDHKVQSCKADVWSLMVTMLVILDIGELWEKDLSTSIKLREAVLAAASNARMSKLKEMAIVDPLKRASAAQMLKKLFNGQGLSTPQHEIPPLDIDAQSLDKMGMKRLRGGISPKPQARKRPAAAILGKYDQRNNHTDRLAFLDVGKLSAGAGMYGQNDHYAELSVPVKVRKLSAVPPTAQMPGHFPQAR